MTTEQSSEAIAIDGPAASGKTTIGHLLAVRLGYLLLDTGCMYRAVTLAVLREGVDPTNEEVVVAVAKAIQLDIAPVGNHDDGRLYTVLLADGDITWQIRSASVDLNVSLVSAYKEVRQEMVRRQRLFASRGRMVVVGRDIGTVVLPEAPLKLYVVASAEERARRRWLEMVDRGDDATFETILQEIIRRDQFDGGRQHSPMKPAADAIVVDTSGRTLDDILNWILSLPYFQEREASGP